VSPYGKKVLVLKIFATLRDEIMQDKTYARSGYFATPGEFLNASQCIGNDSSD